MDRAPEGLTLQSVGPITLPGFATPDDAHGLVGVGLVTVNSVSSSRASHRGGTVPSIDEELVGRSDELTAIWDALKRTRLVTLVGVGGMGKTRLALEVAVDASTTQADGAWWIDLANATSPDAVPSVAMAAVGARETPGRTALQAVCDRFMGVTGLVVIDNCEHVLTAARNLISTLRATATDMQVLATSREALGLRGEHIIPIGSLPTSDGVTLFRERALAVRPDLDITADHHVIERLCTRLDGIPLAIELAAARCRSMTPTDIDNRLSDRFRLLRGGRDSTERHRTLQAAVAWSYDLLDTDEQTVFNQMAVFAGGTLIDGLVAVTGFDEFDMLDIIDRLVARSMVVATSTPLGMRYHQLETLRQYAEDQLATTSTLGPTTDRHLTWAHALAQQIAAARGIDEESRAMARFVAEVDNLRLAVRRALESGQHETAYQIVSFSQRLASFRPVYEVFDWVRPFPADHEWSEASAACAASGVSADVARGLAIAQVDSVDDVPAWYPSAEPDIRSSFIVTHLTSGGDWRIAQELLDRITPLTDEGRTLVSSTGLWIAWFRELISSSDERKTEELVVLANTTVEQARRGGYALVMALVSAVAALALGKRLPDLAVGYAQSATDIADRLGARVPGDLAGMALGFAMPPSGTPPKELLTALRDRAASAVQINDHSGAGGIIWSLVAVLHSVDPAAVFTFWAAWKRVRGYDGTSILASAGITLTADAAAEWELTCAKTSLTDAMRAAVVTLDRIIESQS